MLDTQFTTFFLDLEEVCVTSSSNNSLTIQLPRKSHICPFCGTSTERIHDYRIQKIKHIPLPHKVYDLFLRKRRYNCPNCAKHFAGECNPFCVNSMD